MWQNAIGLIGVPGAIEACLQLLDRIRVGQRSNNDTQAAANDLNLIKNAIGDFAQDAVELAAWKRLHTITNQFNIDLRESFVIDNPDNEFARNYFTKWHYQIVTNWQKVWEGDGAGGKLLALEAHEAHMRYLGSMPQQLKKRTNGAKWEEHFLSILNQATENVENFGIFYPLVGEIRFLNSTLNGHANRQIEKGIDDLDKILATVRSNLIK